MKKVRVKVRKPSTGTDCRMSSAGMMISSAFLLLAARVATTNVNSSEAMIAANMRKVERRAYSGRRRGSSTTPALCKLRQGQVHLPRAMDHQDGQAADQTERRSDRSDWAQTGAAQNAPSRPAFIRSEERKTMVSPRERRVGCHEGPKGSGPARQPRRPAIWAGTVARHLGLRFRKVGPRRGAVGGQWSPNPRPVNPCPPCLRHSVAGAASGHSFTLTGGGRRVTVGAETRPQTALFSLFQNRVKRLKESGTQSTSKGKRHEASRHCPSDARHYSARGGHGGRAGQHRGARDSTSRCGPAARSGRHARSGHHARARHQLVGQRAGGDHAASSQSAGKWQAHGEGPSWETSPRPSCEGSPWPSWETSPPHEVGRAGRRSGARGRTRDPAVGFFSSASRPTGRLADHSNDSDEATDARSASFCVLLRPIRA